MKKGDQISHFKIVRKIREGAWGIVYEAEDTRLGRRVALKFLKAELTQDEEARERFLREARAASALDHPGIGIVYEISATDDNVMYICMSLYRGKSLDKRIKFGPLDLGELITIAEQAGLALAYAHSNKVIHRDIKPANIFITDEGNIKILDFGIAKLLDATPLTKNGTLLGTPAYVSPEQILGKEVDHRCDIWSLGVVLYEMIAGKHPFPGTVESVVTNGILNKDPRPLSKHRPEVPEELTRIVEKAMRKDVEGRYGDMIALCRDLRSFGEKTGVAGDQAQALAADDESKLSASAASSAGGPEERLKIVRDPIFGTIELNSFELLIVNTEIFQRLRRILQVQGASYVYPSATHSRLSHSLGSMHAAGLYVESIPEIRIDPRRKQIVRLAALLHDIGHGIFSHCYDSAVFPTVIEQHPEIYPKGQIGHDTQRHRILQEYLPGRLHDAYQGLNSVGKERLRRTLQSAALLHGGAEISEDTFRSILAQVCQVWKGEEVGSVDFNIVQGPLGADRIDFLQRDAYFAGVPYACIDYQRIIRFAAIRQDDKKKVERLCYGMKTIHCILAFLFSRFLMYDAVYYHRTTRAVDRMVIEVLKLCKGQDRMGLVEKTVNLEKFQELDEQSFFREAREYSAAEGIIADLMNRRLFKVARWTRFAHDWDFNQLSREELEQEAQTKGSALADVLRTAFEKKTGGEKLTVYLDTPLELTVISPHELAGSGVRLYDESRKGLEPFTEVVGRLGYNPYISRAIRPIRVYVSQKDRARLRVLSLLSDSDPDKEKPKPDSKY